jgi:hypothetical protein
LSVPEKIPDLYNAESIAELLKGERRKTVGMTGKFTSTMDPVWKNALTNGRAHLDPTGKAGEGEQSIGDSNNRSIILHKNSPEADAVRSWRQLS